MKITSVESFKLEIPITEDQKRLRYYNKTGVTRIRTDEGITGYGWAEVDPDAAGALLIGKDPIQVERHVADGLGHAFFGAENALWDIVGKAFGQPLHRLWGSYRDHMRLYLTTVWPVDAHQTRVTPEQQADDLAHYASLGYDAFKIRIWRPDFMDDVTTAELVRSQIGGPEKAELMFDRTGDGAGVDWDFDTGVRVADALHEADAQWLEEPFVRGDIERHAHLRAVSNIPITGGEHQPLDVYDDYFQGQSFDIIQPHCANVLMHLKKIAAAAELFDVDCIFHGQHGMNLIGSLQVGATIPSCRMQEIVFNTPPTPPTEAWLPLNNLVKSDELLAVNDGVVTIPTEPGLGIDVDDAAVDRYRVS
jgi:L-alanine-DL-glutamate epimerase-like enolase superfamily enzyme